MKLEDFNYVFTIIGGGWTHIQDMYLITDNRIYYKKNFNLNDFGIDLALNDFTLIIEYDTTNLDFEKHENTTGFDAPTITMYKIINGIDKKLWRVGDYNNSEAVDKIKKIVNEAYRIYLYNTRKNSGMSMSAPKQINER